MTTLVTGATGFLGRGLCERLAQRGGHVRALVRHGTDASLLERLGVEIARGDVLDARSLDAPAEGCRRVVHLAGLTARLSASPRVFAAVNARGTANVARAAARAGVRRIVLSSSTSVYGNAIRAREIREETRTRPDTPYGRSKVAAEAAARAIEAESGVEVVVARIGSTLGRGSTAWTGLFRSIADGSFGLIGEGRNLNQLADEGDIAEGLILCGTEPRAAGRTYVLAGPEAVPLVEFVSRIAEEVGAPAIRRSRLPLSALRLYRGCARIATAVSGPGLPRYDRIEFFLGDRTFDISRAREELGFDPRVPLTESIRRTAQGLRAEGALPAPRPPAAPAPSLP